MMKKAHKQKYSTNNSVKYPTLYDYIVTNSQRDILTGCLVWTGANTRGYAQCSFDNKHISRLHRKVYEHFNGALPRYLYVRHLCHNPRCVEIKHLISGTQRDNMNDMKKAGRSRKGESHRNAKLTEKDIIIINRLLMTGMFERQIAALFGVSRACIAHIHQGKTWIHLKEVM